MKKCFYLANLLMVFCMLHTTNVLALPTSITITTSPANTTVCSGTTARLFIVATGVPSTYLWEVSTDGGGTWATVTDGGIYSGATTDTLSIASSLSVSTYQFLCKAIAGIDTATSSAATITVDTSYVGPVSAPSRVCVGSSATLFDATSGGTWSILHASIDSITTAGELFGLATGVDTISYTITNSCGTFSSTASIDVITLPVAVSITGSSTLCAGSTTALANDSTGGVWSNHFTAIDTVNNTGVVYGKSIGTDTVYYTISNICGSAQSWKLITVDTLPAAISGTSSVCIGNSLSLSESISGGTWSNLHAAYDTVNNAGVVYAIATGNDTISYTLSNACGSHSVVFPITVMTVPVVAAITGSFNICAGAHVTMADATSGGTWSNRNSMVDSINSSGIFYGISHGSDTVAYAVTNTCGTTIVKNVVSVDTLPANISGLSTVCVGAAITLSNTTSGGTWSNAHAAYDSINSAGIVRGVAVGLDTIKYTLTNACGTNSVMLPISVIDVPLVSAILGSSTVCAGATIGLSNATSGGVWSNYSNTCDTINTTGVVYGKRRGTDTVYYTVTNTCGSAFVKKAITIDSLKNPGTITGPGGVCVGSTIILTDLVSGGVWSTAHHSIDTIHGTTFGALYGISAGIDTVKYSVTNACGTTFTTKIISVDTLNAGSITGVDTMCAGITATMIDAATSGVWSSSNSAVALVNTAGLVTAIGGGVDSIIYTVTNNCGMRRAIHTIFVRSLPNAGAIYGSTAVCVGTNIVLYDTASGGTWSNRHSTLDAITAYAADSVKVSALAAGKDTISYTVSNTCGIAKSWYAISIDTAQTAGAITGATHVCAGSTILLSDLPAGGSWTSMLTTVATIDASGHLTGVAHGVDTVVYTYTNACGSSSVKHIDTVYSLPSAGTITGSSAVCIGSVITLYDTTSGGSWYATNGNGTINVTGVFTSVTPGLDTIMYALADAHCIGHAMKVVSIDTMPMSYPITGPSTVCVGSTISLMNINNLGTHTWVSVNGHTSISTAGIVTGVTGGLDTVVYNFSNSCGSISDTTTVTVQTPLSDGALVGPRFVCQGSSITLTDSISGGVWLSSNPYIASIDGPGLVTGRHLGTAIISYTFWNSCGSATDTQSVNVFGVVSAITGMDSVGVGFTRVLSNSLPGGTWVSSNPSIASIDTTGTMLGLSVGVDTISYIVSNPCGVNIATLVVHVGNPPTAGAIFGLDSVCVGLVINMSDTMVLNGQWSVKNARASISSYGELTGVAGPGFDTVYYSVTNGFGIGKVSKKVYVNSIPVVSVHRYPIISIGGSYPLLDTPNTGTWWSSDVSSIAFAAGRMYVLAPTHKGTDTLVYTVTTNCGTTSDTIYYYLPWQDVVENVANPVSTMSVFPNPGQGSFKINFASEIEEVATVTISNIMGQKVSEFTVSSNKLSEFNIDQPDGVYILTAITASKRFDVKVMVTR